MTAMPKPRPSIRERRLGAVPAEVALGVEMVRLAAELGRAMRPVPRLYSTAIPAQRKNMARKCGELAA
jgi:hypothetical protein